MDKPAEAMHLTRRLLDLADDLDLDRDVIGMALIGAGIMVMAEVDPATAERLATATTDLALDRSASC